MADQVFETLRDRLEKKDYADYSHQVDRLLDVGHSATDIASGLLSIFHESIGREGEEIIEDRPPDERRRKERTERREDRPPGERPGGKPPESGEWATLFLPLGRNHNLTAGAIAGMIYNEASLPKGALGRINLFPKHTLIDVKRELAEQAIEGCRSAELFGKPVRLDYDRGRPEERGGDGALFVISGFCGGKYHS